MARRARRNRGVSAKGASARGLTNRASAAGASSAGAPCARSYYATGQAHKRNSSLLGRARQLQALVGISAALASAGDFAARG
jgi:hypothetical protein